MAQKSEAIFSFNRGILSSLGLARLDIARYSMSASDMLNWVPRVLGAMILRPGWAYLGNTQANGLAKQIPFIFAIDDLALIELTDSTLRVRVSDVLVTRALVTAAVTNGNFDVDLAGWTDSDEAGATSAWAAPGYMSLAGTGTNNAIRDQQITVNELNVEHALRIVIARGPVTLRVGTASGLDDYISETDLGTGTHSLAFSPSGNFWIRLKATRQSARLVDSVNVEAAGVMAVPTPWASGSLQALRWTESADIIFLACAGQQQQKIERRGLHSWSVVNYEPEDGPFMPINVGPITIASSGLTGDVTLTASAPLFYASHVGALFRITSTGQVTTGTLAGSNQFTSTVRVVGVGNQRNLGITITGTWVGTITLQYSVGAPGNWIDVETWTANTSNTYDDKLDNQIIYYQLGFKAGAYVSGTASATLTFASGSATGVARVTGFTDSTHVSAGVIVALGGTAATSDWYEGVWSTRKGFPTCVQFHEGRLWWGGKDKLIGSVSDEYLSFDDGTVENLPLGDSGTIQRTIGEGPVDSVYWMISLVRMCIGTASTSANVAGVRIESKAVMAARSSTLDEPLTPTNFNLKLSTAQGVFVDRSGSRLYEVAYDIYMNDFRADELTLMVPDLNEAGILGMALQRRPDTRIHCWRGDGTVGLCVFDRGENVICWSEIDCDGFVEDVAVLPGTIEDQVYYTVRRTINGATVRYVEKWALENECVGATLNKQADAFVIYSGAHTASFSGLSHLEGKAVVGWGDGVDLGVATVAGGTAVFSRAASNAIIGLPYTALWRSMKRSLTAAMGTSLNQPAQLRKIGLLLKDTHASGILTGVDTDNLDAIPLDDLVDGTLGNDVPNMDLVLPFYDHNMTAINDTWSTDPRLVIQASAPRPCTVLGVSLLTDVNG